MKTRRMLTSLLGIVCVLFIAGCSQESAAATDYDAWIGSKLEEREFKRSEACLGFFGGFVKTEEGGWLAAGWAWDSEKDSVPQPILLVDGEGEIIGIADTLVERPGLSEQVSEVTTDKAGWILAVSEDQATKNPFSAYAMLDDTTICALQGEHDLR